MLIVTCVRDRFSSSSQRRSSVVTRRVVGRVLGRKSGDRFGAETEVCFDGNPMDAMLCDFMPDVSTLPLSSVLMKGGDDDQSLLKKFEFIQLFSIAQSDRYLPVNSPPPKLHYSTFWRSLSRRIYHKRQQERRKAARESAFFRTYSDVMQA